MKIAFTDNYQDLSTDKGYQFKFICERCGNGYMSSFQKSKTGVLTSALNIAGGLLGGAAQKIATSTDEVHRMTAGPEHDKAMDKAVQEVSAAFIQCKRCGDWVCREVCWNDEKGLCKKCAPKTGEEVAAMQERAKQEQLREKINEQDYTKGVDITTQKTIRCPHCEAEVDGGAFCNKCGKPLTATKVCPKCQTEQAADAAFCNKCGQQL